jgi:VIT1/CCC1 family predicted Fe2+/Mn2+ transporter
MDEFKHEDVLVTALTERKINAEKIRNIFLGLNDGLVEILGAVSGFFGAFGDATTVLVAASTTAVAGALSMAAGTSEVVPMEESPIGSALVVGAAYIAGAIVPVLPVLIGATNAVFSIITAGLMVVLVSTVLSFLSGMDVKRRILLNLVMIAIAVSVTYGIGVFTKTLWGIAL